MENEELKKKKSKKLKSSTIKMAQDLGIIEDNSLNKNHENDLLRLKSITDKKGKKSKKSKKSKKKKDACQDDISKLLTLLFDKDRRALVEEFLSNNKDSKVDGNLLDEIFRYIEDRKSSSSKNSTLDNKIDLLLEDNNPKNSTFEDSNKLLTQLEEKSSKDNLTFSNNALMVKGDKELSQLLNKDLKEEESIQKIDDSSSLDNKSDFLKLLEDDKEIQSSDDELLEILQSANENLEEESKEDINLESNSDELVSLIEDDKKEESKEDINLESNIDELLSIIDDTKEDNDINIIEESNQKENLESNNDELSFLTEDDKESTQELNIAEDTLDTNSSKKLEEKQDSLESSENNSLSSDAKELLELLEEGEKEPNIDLKESDIANSDNINLSDSLESKSNSTEDKNQSLSQEELYKKLEEEILNSTSTPIDYDTQEPQERFEIKEVKIEDEFDGKYEDEIEERAKRDIFSSFKALLNKKVTKKSKVKKEIAKDIEEQDEPKKSKVKSINMPFFKKFAPKKRESTPKKSKKKSSFSFLKPKGEDEPNKESKKSNSSLFKKFKSAKAKKVNKKESQDITKVNMQQEQDLNLNSENILIDDLKNSLREDMQNSTQNSSNVEFNGKSRYRRISSIMEFQPFVFRGNSKEFFKIWIVNILLTILTLGIYSAWAKVRTNRYLYSSTYLNNSNFEYNADPKKILYGRAIVVGLYALFSYFSEISYDIKIAIGIMIGFLLIIPYLIRQAVSFKFKSASYRNVSFRYNGKIKSFYAFFFKAFLYIIFAILPIIFVGWLGSASKGKGVSSNALSPYKEKILDIINGYGIDIKIIFLMTLAISSIMIVMFIPAIYKGFKDLIINNGSYGQTNFKFLGTKKGAINTFIKMGIGNFLAVAILGGITFGAIIFFGNVFNFKAINFNTQSGNLIITAIIMLVYLSFVGLIKGINDAFLSNYIRNNTKLEFCEFKSEISPLKLGLIGMTNMIAIVFSFGLLYPWAKIRYIRYKLENTQFACDDYNKFVGSRNAHGTALGEETTDFFDIDIGF